MVETFTVGTRLTHLTRAMRLRDPERALVAAGETVPDWSGGTRLGETLRIFMRPLGPARDGPRLGRRRLQRRLGARRPGAAGRADGSGCTASPTASCGSTRTAARRATKPCSKACWRSLPHVDDFVAGHSLATYAELTEVISRA